MAKRRRFDWSVSTEEKRATGETADLEAQADQILSAHGSELDGARLFSEKRLLRKMRRELDYRPHVAEDDPPEEVIGYLIERHISQALQVTGLTRLQLKVYELFLRGVSISEITRRLKLSPQRIRMALQTARSHARKTRGKYDGLYEVYWSEVRRYVYRKPRNGC